MLPENLKDLHKGEESIRTDSLAHIDSNENLTDHMNMIHNAMNHIYAHVQEHDHLTENELTLQLAGIRLFNAAAASIKLGLSGYYQKGFMLVRDLLEVTFLLDYLGSNPEKIPLWKKDGDGPEFKAWAIRKALDERDGYKGEKRREDYKRLCTYASHISNEGFKLIAPDGLGRIGIFFDKGVFTAFIEELAKKITYAAIVFSPHFPNVSAQLSQQKLAFFESSQGWLKKYFS